MDVGKKIAIIPDEKCISVVHIQDPQQYESGGFCRFLLLIIENLLL